MYLRTDPVTIEFTLSRPEAAALLLFLRRLNPPDENFERASEFLCVALRDALEPGWRNKL
jgi:hypothetical protein